MEVSIIIPVYKRTDWIEKCIEKLRGQDFEDTFEIIVIDDGSPNEMEVRKSISGHQRDGKGVIKYFRNRHRGPAAARNYGVRFSSGEILCFLDDDSLPVKEWLREITLPFKDSESTSLVSGMTLSLDRNAALPIMLEKTVHSGKCWATCNIAYRRKIFESLGGFDESFTEPSWEDNELGLRAKWAGYVHLFNEKAIVYHLHENSLEEYKRKCLLNGRGAAVFAHKYLFKKPLWGICTPLIMSRRLMYGIFPSVWMKRSNSSAYLKFLWSFYSLQGFFMSIFRKK
ncbi:MAG: glycosyltransferase family A protein [Nitrospinota bacterium]